MDIVRIARGARFGLLAALLLLVVGSGDRVPRRESPPIPLPAHADTAGQYPLPAGLAPVLATALAADQANAYAVTPLGDQRDAFQATNPAQHLTTAFHADGLAVTGDPAGDASSATWRMHLAAIGDGTALLPVAAAPPTLNGTRVEYRRGNVTEWYVNSPLGVEQGFTLATPPVGAGTGDLVLAVNVTGAVTADDGARGITLALPGGGQARYGELTATDATGRALPARLVADGGEIHIVVDDRGAVYPVVVDPLVQQGSTLLGGGETGAGYFGSAVALSGDGNIALIGAPHDNGNVGAAFAFTRSGGVWTPQGSKLLGSGETGQGAFGSAVALSGDRNTLLIGAVGDNYYVGAAFAFAVITDAVPTGGTPQSAPVGASFATPFSVHAVYSTTGAAAPNTTVTFTAPTVGASGTFPGGATSATVTTDASGNATAPRFTANATAGNYAVLASASGGQAVFALGNAAGSAATIIASTGSNQSATIGTVFSTTLSAVVMDLHHNPVPGLSVIFAIPGSGASGSFAGSSTVTTDSNGVAIAPLFTANAIAGSYTVSATATGVSVPTTFALTTTPGPAASLAFTGFPASVVAGVAQSFTLTARDSGGNIATGYTGTVHFTSSDPAATLPSNYTFTAADQGVHTFAATLPTVGTGRGITATDTVTGSITGSQSGIAVLPAVTTVAPFNGPQAGGTPVTITGIGLTGATSVTIGGSACTVMGVNGAGTSLTCTTRGHAVAGTVDVVVTTPNGIGTLVQRRRELRVFQADSQ